MLEIALKHPNNIADISHQKQVKNKHELLVWKDSVLCASHRGLAGAACRANSQHGLQLLSMTKTPF